MRVHGLLPIRPYLEPQARKHLCAQRRGPARAYAQAHSAERRAYREAHLAARRAYDRAIGVAARALLEATQTTDASPEAVGFTAAVVQRLKESREAELAALRNEIVNPGVIPHDWSKQ